MLATCGVVAFLTDFGTRDTYVGQMKGALLEIAPAAVPVDLTHDVPAHDVEAGGFALEVGSAAFPPGTVFVAVVDPGVGTPREAVLAVTDRAFFVAPDNGILSRVLRDNPHREVVALRNARFRRDAVSSTFHGRDVFAPAAGWLCRGIPPAEMGPRVELRFGPAPARDPRPPGTSFDARVLGIDRFGNVTLDVRVEEIGGGIPVVRTASTAVRRFVRTYGEARAGEPVVLVGSAGYLEIARREARADADPSLSTGASVRVTVERPDARA